MQLYTKEIVVNEVPLIAYIGAHDVLMKLEFKSNRQSCWHIYKNMLARIQGAIDLELDSIEVPQDLKPEDY